MNREIRPLISLKFLTESTFYIQTGQNIVVTTYSSIQLTHILDIFPVIYKLAYLLFITTRFCTRILSVQPLQRCHCFSVLNLFFTLIFGIFNSSIL